MQTMLCSADAGKQVAKRRRSEDTVERSGPNAIRQRTYAHISTSEHARAQFGDQYYQTFNGPVRQSASLVAPSTAVAPERKVIDALRFDGMELRQNTIKVAYGNTCQWFFDSPEFKKWRADSSLEEHHGFMWIRGKPGAGKSTLMKLAVKDASSWFADDLQVSFFFFFNAKGTALEKSGRGDVPHASMSAFVTVPETRKSLPRTGMGSIQLARRAFGGVFPRLCAPARTNEADLPCRCARRMRGSRYPRHGRLL